MPLGAYCLECYVWTKIWTIIFIPLLPFACYFRYISLQMGWERPIDRWHKNLWTRSYDNEIFSLCFRSTKKLTLHLWRNLKYGQHIVSSLCQIAYFHRTAYSFALYCACQYWSQAKLFPLCDMSESRLLCSGFNWDALQAIWYNCISYSQLSIR